MFEGINLASIFTTGLVTGGLACLAVQGGLLTATLAQRESAQLATSSKPQHLLPILSFLLAKLIAYTLLGFALGWLGSLVQLSLQTRIVMQFLVVVFMIGTALNMLQVHPMFRYFVIQPPRWLTRVIRKQSKRTNIFAPAVLGASTVLIPCGVTQAMMALAITSGNPLLGAIIMCVFTIGTSPVFFLLGYLTMKLGDVLQKQFLRVAAVLILLLAFINLEATVALTGTPYTFATIGKGALCVLSYCEDSLEEPISEATIVFTPGGYSPNSLTVKAGEKVTLHLVNENAGGCIQAFTIPSLGIQELVAENKRKDISFIAPKTPGIITFTCSMGMYPGTITVL